VEVTHDGNMASGRVGKLWLVAAGRRPIEDDTWRQCVGHGAASMKSGPFHGVLFWTPTHGPSAPQRKMLTDELARSGHLDVRRRVALISGSAFVRGTITAIRWFTRSNVAVFAPKEAHRALDWLAEAIAFDRTQAQRALDEIIDAVQGKVPKSGIS